MQGYFLAALLFLGIVFSLPMSLGMFALALDLPVNVDEALAGLVMPASAYVLLGKSGAPGLSAAAAVVRASPEGSPWCKGYCSHYLVYCPHVQVVDIQVFGRV